MHTLRQLSYLGLFATTLLPVACSGATGRPGEPKDTKPAEKAGGARVPAKPAFDLEDRARTDAYLEGLIARAKQAMIEPNPVVQQDQQKALRQELEKLIEKVKGKKVQWRFKTDFITAPMTAIRAPSQGGKGVTYLLSSDKEIDNVRGIILGGVTKVPVPPLLVVDRDISREESRKVRPGQEFPVTGTILDIKFDIRFVGYIDVYVSQAKIIHTAGKP